MMQDGKIPTNKIPEKIVKTWRRDIVKIKPVFKIASDGTNILGHSAPFPEDIPDFAIRSYSYTGDVVLDPYMGSGTVGRVARKLDRKWIGFELHDTFKHVIDKQTLKHIKDIRNFF